MNKEDFFETVKDALSERLGDGYMVSIRKIPINNNIVLNGLLILKDGKNVSPVIYLDKFFEAYGSGEPFDEIIGSIERVYRDNVPKDNIDMDFFKDFALVKDRICFRLISFEKNEMLLKDIPYIKFYDMAVCFFYAYRGDCLGEGIITVHNNHMKMWNTTVEELYELAGENTPRLFPWSCMPVLDMLDNLCQGSFKLPGKDGLCGELQMYVLSNEKNVNGAAVMLYPGLMEKIAQKIGSDFLILPSSIHETILLADGNFGEKDEIKAIINEVNNTKVEPEQILSYSLYYYDNRDKIIKLL